MFDIYIIGAGQIGSRHLQALKSVNSPLSVKVIDPYPESLKIARERYESMPKGQFQHTIEYLTEIPKNKKSIDLAIIATCSDKRAGIIKKLLALSKVKNLVLEKILFNKKTDYDFIKKLLQKSKTKAWINCTVRMMPTYQKIEKYFKGKKISYIVTGSKFGLVTNAIHYLDHTAHLSGITKFGVNTTGLDPKPIPSKRKGFLEFNGTLTAHFGNGSNASLTCYPDGDAPVIVEIHSDSARYIGRESEGKAWLAIADNNWQWEELEAPIPFQSQLTGVLVEKILNTGKCDLVPYNESKKIHLQMLEPLLKFINKDLSKKYNYYPFT
ncbi:MAG: Gfo/Idh/MocA family oxidoreductase [bacterium]|nr:Gfo/Idh/MocA family oxidoreductase [bacterium]